MSVDLENVYTLIVEYQNGTDSSIAWRNTYDLFSPTEPSDTAAIITALGGFTGGMVHSDSNWYSMKLYNWSRGATPYPGGSALWEYVNPIPGDAATYWTHLSGTYTPAGGEVCLRVDHQTVGRGRPGRNFFRGLLGEGDISALSGGRYSLTPTVAHLQADLDGLLTASGLAAYFNPGGGEAQLAKVFWSNTPGYTPSWSAVAGFHVVGVTTNKLSRKRH